MNADAMHASRSLQRVGARLESAFPVPRFLVPLSMGVDISDSSIKWLVLDKSAAGFRVARWGEVSLPEGVVVSGAVRDEDALATHLAPLVATSGGVAYAHAALPEESAYVFSMYVPHGTPREQVVRMIEFEFEGRVPIAPSAAVYDYDIIGESDAAAGTELAVSVFAKDDAGTYARAFSKAGIQLLSLEIEARSIARAISSGAADEPITLLVDFGRMRTGIAVLKRGLPIFTTTVDVGGGSMLRTLADRLGVTLAEAERLNNEEGLTASSKKGKEGMEVLAATAGALADEVARHYRYWDTRRDEHGDRVTPVGRVFLVGGNSNMKGLAGYIAGRVQAPTERPDVWQHIASFDEYIPPIERRYSLQYVTAIGLALRGV